MINGIILDNLTVLDINNGEVKWQTDFTYWMLLPIHVKGRLYTATDLKVIAYNIAALQSARLL